MIQDARLEQLTQWVHSLSGWQNARLETASADASFRRYFRAIQPDNNTAIVMDAPPELEDTTPFVEITERLHRANNKAPTLMAQDLSAGFLLMEDFGDRQLGQALTPNNVDRYYQQAMQALIKLQRTDNKQLPIYDEAMLLREMQLMPEWFLQTHLGFTEQQLPEDLITQTLNTLSHAVYHPQPQVFVHRDYHSRNLMLTPGNDREDCELGIIDYQDAVLGPVTYDLVSLLRDCYVGWPEKRVYHWARAFRHQALAAGILPAIDEHSFLRWFDLTGLQRHLKVLGIFSRLYHRDGKSNYLNDLPLVLSYVLTVGARHPETTRLINWMHEAGIPERIGTVNIPA